MLWRLYCSPVQTSSPPPSPWDDFWVQTASNIVGGVAVAIVVGVGTVLSTVVYKKWRRAIWGNVGRFLRWLGTLRLTTKSRIEAERELGRVEVREQIASERETVPQPRWDIRPLEGDPAWFMLRNFGAGVIDISVTAPIDQFAFDTAATWPHFGPGVTGKQFKGQPLPAGRATAPQSLRNPRKRGS